MNEYLETISIISACLGIGLGILNFLIAIFTIKNIRKNRLLFVISIIATFFEPFGMLMIENVSGGIYIDNDGNVIAGGGHMPSLIDYSLCIIPCIIQIVIFIKLIINIKDNKKRRENLTCQE